MTPTPTQRPRATKRVLMIAFHYPPFQGSSGILRTWNFTRYLPSFGWQPLLLTASEKAYGLSKHTGAGGLQAPPDLPIWRAAGLDAARHLSIKGRYPKAFALPDRWASWCVPAIARAMSIIRQHRPQLIWSTYPIASAHLIGLAVQRLSGLPWVADFRDSMTEEGYPPNVWDHRAYVWIERKALKRARQVVFTTTGTRAMYAERYPERPPETSCVITNGYDEDDFRKAESLASKPPHADPRRKIRLVHSGIIYPSERDPRPFLDALARLKESGVISAETLAIAFRASGHDGTIRPLIEARKLGDIVTLESPLPYHQALAELLTADGLLLFQAANCNHQIPAKLYEYLRAGRPILALTDARGDTAATLRSAGAGVIADLASADDIVARMPVFLEAVRAEGAQHPQTRNVEIYSRESQARELAALLDRVAMP